MKSTEAIAGPGVPAVQDEAPLAGRAARRRRAAFALALGLALVAAVALRAGLARRPTDVALDMLVDDAFISLSVARSLAAGRGLQSSATPTSGTQPLYVLLAAPLYVGLDDEGPAGASALDRAAARALVLLHLFELIAGALFTLFVYRALGRAAAVVAAVCWTFHPMVLGLGSNGLETVIAFAFLVAVVYAVEFHLADDAGPRTELLLGLLLGFACLARIDLAFLGAFVLLMTVWGALRGRLSPRRAVARLAWIGVGFAAVYGPWVAYLWSQTGDLLPVSGPASRYLGEVTRQRFKTEHGYFMAKVVRGALLFHNPAFLAGTAAFAAAAVAAAVWRRDDPRVGHAVARLARLRLLALFCAVIYVAYVYDHGGWWYMQRYLSPILLLQFSVLCGAVAVLRRAVPRAAGAVVAAACALAVVSSLAAPGFWNLYSLDRSATSYRRAGLWAREHLAPGAVVGAWESGALAYYATQADVVNLDGVVDRGAYEALRRGELDGYLERRGVETVVGCEAGRYFIEEHGSRRGLLETVGPVVGARPGGRGWYVCRVVK